MSDTDANEFSLIAHYFQNWPSFQQCLPGQFQSSLENGDDCFAFSSPLQQVVSTDTLVESVHFLAQAPAYFVAYRALASSVSDLAAMGAKPAFFTLAITLSFDEAWLAEFARGLQQAAKDLAIDLKGGDTTKSNSQTVLTLTVFGVCEQPPLTQAQAKSEDVIVVSGELGNASGALAYLKYDQPTDSQKQLLDSYYQPKIPLLLAQQLAPYAHACIDISDGLLADLGHICRHSQVSAQLDYDRIPLSNALLVEYDQKEALGLALTGGDDYQLCFTISKQNMLKIDYPNLKVIGKIIPQQSTLIVDQQQQDVQLKYPHTGYQHF